MQLTSREQALLTVVLDAYISAVPAERCDTECMWAELYDAVVCADIDDIGEEYDPSAELDWDVETIDAWARDMKDGEDKYAGAEDVAFCVTNELAETLFDALNRRFIAEYEEEIDWAAEEAARQEAAEEAVTQVGPTTVNYDSIN